MRLRHTFPESASAPLVGDATDRVTLSSSGPGHWELIAFANGAVDLVFVGVNDAPTSGDLTATFDIDSPTLRKDVLTRITD